MSVSIEWRQRHYEVAADRAAVKGGLNLRALIMRREFMQ